MTPKSIRCVLRGCRSLVDSETQGNVLKSVILAGLAATIVFLAAIMPVGTPDHVSGERSRVVDEVTDFIETEIF